MAKITGIGGVFFKAQSDKKALADWYQTHFGIKLEDFGGAVLNWDQDVSDDKGISVWCVADRDSDWFEPSKSSFMINYRIDDMAGMIEQLQAGGVDILEGPESAENGKFLWIMDPDGNKVELWEPKLWDDKNKVG